MIFDFSLLLDFKVCSSKGDAQLIGCFSGASNVTGILTDTNAITACLHRGDALAFWDYATAGNANANRDRVNAIMSVMLELKGVSWELSENIIAGKF